jgi:hypothetical protein
LLDIHFNLPCFNLMAFLQSGLHSSHLGLGVNASQAQLSEGWRCRHPAVVQRRRRAVAVQASLIRQLCLTAAGAAAIGATAVVLQRFQQQQQQQEQQQTPRQVERDGSGSGGNKRSAVLPPPPTAARPLFNLGWPNREKLLQKTVRCQLKATILAVLTIAVCCQTVNHPSLLALTDAFLHHCSCMTLRGSSTGRR